MRVVLLFLAVQLFFLLFTLANVVELNEKNFDEETGGEGGYLSRTDDVWIVSFHAVSPA